MIKDNVIKWIKDYADKHNKTTLVVGISGGIDSAVTSALCAHTGLKTMPVVMSIKSRDILALDQIWWLDDNYTNVSRRIINLEKIFHEFVNASKYLGAVAILMIHSKCYNYIYIISCFSSKSFM